MSKETRILVVGAGGALGFEILSRLRAQGHAVTGSYRTLRPGLEARIAATGATPARLDLRDRAVLADLVARHDTLVFTPILTDSAGALAVLRPGQRMMFLSSNNVEIDPGDPLYAALSAAEQQVRKAAPRAVILRPTMIYGHPADRNLSRLLRAARRWPLLPRPATPALQQPVHVHDLAEIAADVLFDPDATGATIAVAGPRPVTYRQLYRAVSRAAGRRTLAVPVPVPAALAGLWVLRRLGVAVPVKEGQLLRTRQDKRPRGTRVILGTTPLEDGLRALAEELARERPQVAGSSPS